MNIQEAIEKVVKKNSLVRDEMSLVMSDIVDGNTTPSQIAGFATALRMKGESPAEIAAAAEILRARATKINVTEAIYCDTCGTGGDGSGTFNISTTAAFVVAGAGVPVAKHGNRGISSKCGSADVLHALGVDIEADVETVERAIEEAHIGFLFAPRYHQALKHAAIPRKELGIRTFFNLLGPLVNPAAAPFQVVGIYDPSLLDVVAKALVELGVIGAMVVHGSDGLDEITLTGSTSVVYVKDGATLRGTIEPATLGFKICSPKDLLGGDPKDNGEILEAILDGEESPRRDIVTLNAAAALMTTQKYLDWSQAIGAANDSIRSGKAKGALNILRQVCPA